MLLQTAKLLARNRVFTEKEIELWVKHVSPVWKRNPSWMKQAVINWYAAMQDAGLAADGPNEMERFIRNGIDIPGT
jgi:hypothetical protein